MNTQETVELPESKLTKNQKKIYGWKVYAEGGRTYRIKAEVRHDDECSNGHNTFSITGEIQAKRGNHFYESSFGCLHDEIAKQFPELAPFIKWHLTSTESPLHYVANAKYWAGHCGYRDGKPHSPPNLDYVKSTIVYGTLPTGKDFDLADRLYSDQRGFTWNEAKAHELEDWLVARMSALMAEFKTAVESLGFTY